MYYFWCCKLAVINFTVKKSISENKMSSKKEENRFTMYKKELDEKK